MSGRPRRSISTAWCAITSCAREPWQGDIAVQLLDKEKRSRSSHDIALYVRRILTPIAAASGARLTVAEAPPGPPVLAPMVIELYGPTPEIRRQVARDLIGILHKTPHIADINTFMEAPHDNLEFEVDRLRAAMFGVSVEDINREVSMATGGFEAGAAPAHPQSRTGGDRAADADGDARQYRQSSGRCRCAASRGDGAARRTRPLRQASPVDPVIYHKDLRAVEYVTADVVGKLGAPLYGMLERRLRPEELRHARRPDDLSGNYFSRPDDRRPQRLQMGRRMGSHLCDLPRHGPGLRRRAGADLHSGRRRVPQLHAAGGGDDADPADPDRHRARPLAAGRAISPRPR